jgi:hypothetical protein
MFFGQDLAVMHDTGSLGFQSITLARYDAALYFPVFNGSARWKLGAGFTSPLSSAEDSQEAESVTTLSYQIFFGRKDLDR